MLNHTGILTQCLSKLSSPKLIRKNGGSFHGTKAQRWLMMACPASSLSSPDPIACPSIRPPPIEFSAAKKFRCKIDASQNPLT